LTRAKRLIEMIAAPGPLTLADVAHVAARLAPYLRPRRRRCLVPDPGSGQTAGTHRRPDNTSREVGGAGKRSQRGLGNETARVA